MSLEEIQRLKETLGLGNLEVDGDFEKLVWWCAGLCLTLRV